MIIEERRIFWFPEIIFVFRGSLYLEEGYEILVDDLVFLFGRKVIYEIVFKLKFWKQYFKICEKIIGKKILAEIGNINGKNNYTDD